MKFRIILVLALLLQLVVVPLQSLASEADTKAPTWVTPINYLALGDSLAYGISSDGLPGDGYPDFLAQSLNGANVLKSSNKGFSFPGYTASDVLKDLQENVTKPVLGIGQEGQNLELHKSIAEANLITISVGANDVLQYVKIDPKTGAPQIDLQGLATGIQQVGINYNQILKRIYAINPTVQVYVMGYYNPFPHLGPELQPQLAQLLVGLNGSIQAGMKGTNAVLVPTAEAIATNFLAHLPNPQNIHLSEVGYKIVAEQFNNQLQVNYQWFAKDTLTATIKNDTTVTVTWKPAVDNKAVAGYVIYSGKEKVGQVNGDVHTFDVANLTGNKEYTFTVSAIDEEKNESVLNPVAKIKVGSAPVVFSDIENHWAKEFIEQAAVAKMVNGYPDGTFKPENKLTRTQAASILVRALGLKTDEAAPFKDINGYNKETQAEIGAAYKFGLVKGSEGKFKPSEPVTRSQLALMVKRSYELVTGEPYVVTEFAPFPDIGNFDIETKIAISMLYNFKIINGSDGKYLPANAATRGQTAKIFVNYLNHIQDLPFSVEDIE